MKIRDKRCEGEEFSRNRKRRRHKPVRHFALVHLKGHYADLHAERVEYHTQRVAGEEKILRDNGIDPNRRGSAYKLDNLMTRRIR